MLVESISININRRKYAHNNLSFKATDHSELLKLPDRTIFNQIRNGKIQLSQKDYDGNTILHILIKENKYNLVQNLLLDKSNKEILLAKNNKGQTPIDLANTEEMKIYLSSYNDNHINTTSNDNNKEDARIILTKQTINSSIPTITQKEELSYFNSFEEVEEKEFTKTLSEVAKENINSSKILCEDCDGINYIKDFKLLEIWQDEPATLKDVIGQDDIKRVLEDNIIKPLTNAKAYQTLNESNIDLPNGLLFVTPENSLTLVKALANDAKLPTIQLESPTLLNAVKKAVENRYNNTGLKTIILAKGFDKFFENISDPVALNNFRNEIRSIKKVGGLFIATTDDKSKINCDFMQSSIIDKVFEVKKPNFDDRKAYLKRFFDKSNDLFKEINNEEAITKFASIMDNLTYSDIKRILDQTATIAIANDKAITSELLENQLKTFSEETGRVPINELNRTSAYDTENFKRIPVEEDEMMSLDELGGMPEVKAKLRDLYVKPMKEINELQKIFGPDAIPDGAIFYGAPGNGKTLTARVLARELGLPYYETRLSDFGTALVHESGKAFRRYADQLDRKFKETGERSVWFLDEFDGLGSSRENRNNYTDRELVNTLLQELSNPAKRGYILIAATNNLENVDSALKRRGRLGNWIEFKNPNQEEREDTIKKNLLKHDITQSFANDNELVALVAKELDGFSMSSIINILKDAKRDFYLNKTDFSTAVKNALENNILREMGEFCGKTGLKRHKYEPWNFNSLNELSGLDEVINTLKETVINTWDPEVRKAMIANKRIPSGGFILEGPPGTGKTTIIETLAREMDVPLYKMNYNQEGNQYIHQTAKQVNEIFERLALESKVLKKPVMLFFDEAEKFFPKDAKGHQIEEVNTYKDLMNTATAKGIILAGATNHIDQVNQEIIGNPRRMGNVIHCGSPDEKGVRDLISNLFRNLPILNEDLSEDTINELAALSIGLTIGAISDIADKIIVQAIKKKENLSTQKIIEGFKLMGNKIYK